jgi:predicted transcriptional regulator
MDFSMQGQFRAIKLVSSVVPFFNARLQGLYKLGRDGITPTYRVICNTVTGQPIETSDKQKAMRFATISSAVMLASMALYGMYKDDEDFKRREEWDRDNFWWFKIGDTAYRIPKPFEIGALGTLAERTYEQIADDTVEGKVFFQRLNSILANNLSMNPMPQIFKPLIDLYANKDSFTGAPIESAGMQNLSAQERVTNRTSGIAIALGGVSSAASKVLTFNPEAQGISPVQVDYAIKSYLGWAGATAVATADLAVEPFSEGTKVRPPIIDTVAMGFIKTEPQTQSRYMTEFYQTNARVQSALADMRHYAELGDSEKVQKIMEEKGNDIALAKVYDKTSKEFAKIRQTIRVIEQRKDISPEDKRAEMNRLRILMSDIAAQMESMKKSLNK